MLLRALLLIAVLTPAADACTCFFVANQAVALFARNYDWHFEQGMLTVNKRGVEKTALTFDGPAKWTSQYGSVTFNQYGREFPNDGMNEAGLTVAVMWLSRTQYPAVDERPSVGSAQWVQYQLDTAATVADVLASDAAVRITPVAGGLVHYLVADASGAAAIIEWIDGRRVVHTGEKLAAAALANSTYERSVASLARYTGFGGEQPLPTTRASLHRFARAADLATTGAADADWSIDDAFAGLRNVAQQGRTQWSIVYDLRRRAIEFTTRSEPTIKRVAMSGLDLSTATPTKVLSLTVAEAGDIASRLTDFNTEQNLEQINAAFDATVFLRPWPTAMRERIARYPELECRPLSATVSISGGE